jgi:uncharacterized damage-inducible protein DinB
LVNSESVRIADQLHRAFKGDAWHGSPLSDLLAGITAEQAVAHKLPSAHSIWELVLHIHAYMRIALEATQGVPMPKLFGTEKDWPTVENSSAAAWADATRHLLQIAEHLAQAIGEFTDARLLEIVPGRQYNFYHLFHGIVQHSLYHGGQIAMLKRAD